MFSRAMFSRFCVAKPFILRYLNSPSPHLHTHTHTPSQAGVFLFPPFLSFWDPFMWMTNMDLILNVWGKKINCFQVVCQARDTESEHRIPSAGPLLPLPSPIFVCFLEFFYFFMFYLLSSVLALCRLCMQPAFSRRPKLLFFPQNLKHRVGEGSLEPFQTNKCSS